MHGTFKSLISSVRMAVSYLSYSTRFICWPVLLPDVTLSQRFFQLFHSNCIKWSSWMATRDAFFNLIPFLPHCYLGRWQDTPAIFICSAINRYPCYIHLFCYLLPVTIRYILTEQTNNILAPSGTYFVHSCRISVAECLWQGNYPGPIGELPFLSSRHLSIPLNSNLLNLWTRIL